MSDRQYITEIDVRFRDLDPLRHVNNSVYVTYLETARAAFYDEIVGTRLEEMGTVLAHLEIDFQQPILAEHDVTVALTVKDLGHSSIPMAYEIRIDDGKNDQALAASAKTVQVCVDSETGEVQSIPSLWRECITSWQD